MILLNSIIGHWLFKIINTKYTILKLVLIILRISSNPVKLIQRSLTGGRVMLAQYCMRGHWLIKVSQLKAMHVVKGFNQPYVVLKSEMITLRIKLGQLPSTTYHGAGDIYTQQTLKSLLGLLRLSMVQYLPRYSRFDSLLISI